MINLFVDDVREPLRRVCKEVQMMWSCAHGEWEIPWCLEHHAKEIEALPCKIEETEFWAWDENGVESTGFAPRCVAHDDEPDHRENQNV